MALKQVIWILSTGIGTNECILFPVILQMYQKIAFCRLVIKDNVGINCWNVFVFNNSCFFKDIYCKERYSGSEVIQYIKDQPNIFSIECCPFFKTILQSIEPKDGWILKTTITKLLKVGMDSPGCNYTISELNEQFAFLQEN